MGRLDYILRVANSHPGTTSFGSVSMYWQNLTGPRQPELLALLLGLIPSRFAIHPSPS